MYKVPRSNVSVFNINNNKSYLIRSLIGNHTTLEPPPDPNRAILFGTKAINDDEIISATNYKFNLDVEVLISNSNNTRLSKINMKNGSKKPPRRQNAWILYRKDKSVGNTFKGKKSSEISKEIARMWIEEPKEVKVLFEALSRMAVKRHIERYGENYKYEPSKPKHIRKKGQLSSSPKSKNSSPKLTMDVEQELLPSPATSSPATPSSSEFEETSPKSPKSPTNTEQQSLPTPATSLPSTPSEELLAMDIEQQNFPTSATSSPATPLSEIEETLLKLTALPVTPPPSEFEGTFTASLPVIPESTESTKFLPESTLNTEQQYPISFVSEELSESIINTGQQFFPTPVTSNFNSPVISSPFVPEKSSLELLELAMNAKQQPFPTPMTSIYHSPLTSSYLEPEVSSPDFLNIFPSLLDITPSSLSEELSLESIMNAEKQFFEFDEESSSEFEELSLESIMNTEKQFFEFNEESSSELTVNTEECLSTPIIPSSLELLELEELSKNFPLIPPTQYDNLYLQYTNNYTLTLDSFTPIRNLSDEIFVGLLCPDTIKSENLDKVKPDNPPEIATNTQFSEELLTMTDTYFSYYANQIGHSL